MAAEDLAISDPHPAPGSSVILTATLGNSGDLPVSNARLAFSLAIRRREACRSRPCPAGAAGWRRLGHLRDERAGAGQQPAQRVVRRRRSAQRPGGVRQERQCRQIRAFGPNLALEVTNIEYWSEGYIAVETAVRNTGAGSSGGTLLRFYRDAITGTLAFTDTVPAAGCGRRVHRYNHVARRGLPAGSTRWWRRSTTTRQDFGEAYTGDNNTLIAVRALPNCLSALTSCLSSRPAKGVLTVTFTVANAGYEDVNNVILRLIASDPVTGTILLEETLPALAAGAYVELSRRVSGLPPDQKEIYAWVNPELVIQESSYDDNLALARPESKHTIYLPLIQRK